MYQTSINLSKDNERWKPQEKKKMEEVYGPPPSEQLLGGGMSADQVPNLSFESLLETVTLLELGIDAGLNYLK